MAARLAPSTGQEALQGFVGACAAPGATVRPDDAGACESLRCDRGPVRHALQAYVRRDVRTNGVESLGSRLQRVCQGTFPKLSLERCVRECAGCRNLRERDTLDQLRALRRGLERRRLTSRGLIRDHGRPAGARRVAEGPA